MTDQERRALAFIALLITASVAMRLRALPELQPEIHADEIAADALADSSQRLVEQKAAAARPLAAGERLDPNTADATQLDRLPRVGPALARRIVEARKGRPFRTTSDLTRVPGIGPQLATRLAPHLTLKEGSAPPGGSQTRVLRSRAQGAAPISSADRRVPAGGAAARRPERGHEGGPSPASPTKLNPNTATQSALEALPGIGPALAERIIQDRQANGPYRRRPDLLRVKGIGPKMLARLGPLLDLPP